MVSLQQVVDQTLQLGESIKSIDKQAGLVSDPIEVKKFVLDDVESDPPAIAPSLASVSMPGVVSGAVIREHDRAPVPVRPATQGARSGSR